MKEVGDSAIIDAFRHIQIPLLIIAPDGAVRHCNRAANRLFGYDDTDLMSRSISEILPIASVAELNAHIKPPAIDAVIKGMIGRMRSGAPIPLVIRLTAWTDANGAVQHALVLQDVTEEMKSANSFREELQRANNAITGARIGVFEYDVPTDRVIVSDIWCELFELEDLDRQVTRQEWQERMHPEDLDALLNPFWQCVEDSIQRASCDYRFRAKDRSHWRWMRTDFAISKRDKTGKVERVAGTTRDITERRTAEEAYYRIAEQFRSSFENATIGKAIVALDGTFIKVNPALCAFLGYSEEDLFRTDFQSLTHPEDLDRDLAQIELLKSGRASSYQLEKRYVRANGAIMWGLLSVGIVRNAEGQAEHFISEIVDVTERRRLNELKSEFVATVSHELRTPLTSVLGSLSLLSSIEAGALSEGAQRLLKIAQNNGNRLHALINDILDFEKFSAGEMRFSLSHQRIAELLRESLTANQPLAEKFGVRFLLDCPDSALTGFVDPKRFQQVMSNLLSNAAKFADEGSEITVTARQARDAIRVSVTNQGMAIPAEFHEKIFQPFSQATPVANRNRGGTGLGLSITKQIVEQTGGTIGFSSEDGAKTTFWFTLPDRDLREGRTRSIPSQAPIPSLR